MVWSRCVKKKRFCQYSEFCLLIILCMVDILWDTLEQDFWLVFLKMYVPWIGVLTLGWCKNGQIVVLMHNFNV